MISTGSCGAFIHGLEDEYLEVRSECVVSLGKLASSCPEFAAKSIDFLVDMFNDEIENVRLMSIQALCKITHYVLLTDDQIDIVLPVLEVCFFNPPLEYFIKTKKTCFYSLRMVHLKYARL